MRWLDGIINAMHMNLGNLWEMVRDGQALRATIHGVKKSRTWLNEWTKTTAEDKKGAGVSFASATPFAMIVLIWRKAFAKDSSSGEDSFWGHTLGCCTRFLEESEHMATGFYLAH